jgi:hypothetical protein
VRFNIQTLNVRQGGYDSIFETDSGVRVAVAGLSVTLYERDGRVDIQVDPMDGEALSVGAVEIAYNASQARMKLRGSGRIDPFDYADDHVTDFEDPHREEREAAGS